MEKLVSIFKNVYSTEKPHLITIGTALQRIRDGHQKERVEAIRNAKKKKEKAELKRDLPIVLFSGEFESRNDEKLDVHSGYIVLDFDHIDVEDSKKVLGSDDYIHACWVSPSGDGIKAIVKITNPERHRDHFRSLCLYFQKEYGLEVDSSGINESRACYESYDPELVVNEHSKSFGGMATEASLNQKAEVKQGVTDYEKLNIAVAMVRNAPDGEKHQTLVKASYLVGGFISAGRIEEEEGIRVLEREIAKKDVDDLTHASRTIREGVEKGKLMPISETMREADKARLEMRLADMDMSFISSDDVDYGWIEDYAEGRIQLGLSSGNSILDNHFLFKKEFMMINGHSNVGKTTFALWLIMSSSINHGWRWLIYSAENKTASIKKKLMEFAMGMKVDRMNYKERKAAYDWVAKHFIVIDNSQMYSYHEIMMFAEKILRTQGFDGLFIDPYNSLRIDLSSSRGVSTHEYHYEAASEFLTFSNTRNVAVWVNAHSVTESQRRKGDDGLSVAPFAEDTEGGGKFVNRADGFITLHRKIQHPDPTMRRTIEMHVRKVRETETGGQPTPYSLPLMFEFLRSEAGYGMCSPYPDLYQPLVEKFRGEQTEII